MEKIDENTIQNWIVEENLFKEKIVDENANFHYVIEYPKENIIDIIQPKGKDDLLVFICGTRVSPEHIELMMTTSQSKRSDFIFDLRFKLNQLSCEFQLDVDNNYALGQFILQDGIYTDGLSKNEMMKVLKGLFKAKMTCIWLLEKDFGEPEVLSNSSTSNDNMMFM